MPWRGYGTAPLATLLALPVDRMAGSDHLPQRPKHTVAADFKETACSQACTEVPEGTLVPKEIKGV